MVTGVQTCALPIFAFFGEKYGEVVRVLVAGPHSVELCGGTHVEALGEIGSVKVVTEGSIGSNIRRIEAVTGLGVIGRLRDAELALRRGADLVGATPDDMVEGIERRLGDIKSLRDELKSLRRELAGSQADELVGSAVDGVVIAQVESESRNDLRDLAVALRDRGMRAVILASAPGGKGAALVAAVSPQSGLNAADLIAEATSAIGGGGGKGAELAVAGGRDADGIPAALDLVRARLG